MERLRSELPETHRTALNLVLEQTTSPLYLVGGIVRDLLLTRENFDLDFVCLEYAGQVATRLLPTFEATFAPETVNLTIHEAFGTATINIGQVVHLDFATARLETYAHPAALPTVHFPASLLEDMQRRDFTINSLALSPESGLYDPFKGLEDLQDGWLRVLHPTSFQDDPTRMVRGVRFAARFGYRFEPETERLLEEALREGYFDLLSAERKRNELRLILKELRPEKGLALLKHYGLLSAIHPLLRWDSSQEEAFARLPANLDYRVQPYQYLAALLYNSGANYARKVLQALRFAGLEADVPLEVATLWEQVRPQLQFSLKNSQLYDLLHGYRTEALRVFEALLTDPAQITLVRRYREELGHRLPVLNGDFLIKLGIPRGPRIGALLAELRRATLDGEISGEEEEAAFLRRQSGLE